MRSSNPGAFLPKLFDDRVLRAGALGRPVQMMRLIHNQHVPSGGERLLGSLLAVGEQRDAAKDQLGLQEWVAVTRGLTSLLIVNVKPEIEAAQQFDEPLVNKRLGHENKDSLGSAGEDRADAGSGMLQSSCPARLRQREAHVAPGAPKLRTRCKAGGEADRCVPRENLALRIYAVGTGARGLLHADRRRPAGQTVRQTGALQVC